MTKPGEPFQKSMLGHGDDCECTRCRGFAQGNDLAVTHGATSERRIGHEASVHKRRMTRQIGLRQRDLDALGRALLANWARAAAALSLMDAYGAEHGWLDKDGEPRGFARLYVSMLNSERLTLTRLEKHLTDRSSDPQVVLRDWIEALPESEEDGDASSA